ncbi:bacteriocin fulvocin C-related protein [Chryseobacterium sp. Ch-15]|uniref:Bacteriocin fulvocin C-related protein n=1 Tax=Chryseobacterium muglaense TaxID=2893752 RepID=A0A9Q3YS11_9FLAO|nr:bacteriocin fulvocin C-related protein [Chryseobacterium muglaense]MBD3903748.1 bacteriocin fulvocin C-related protein [Chryseobacterium muglaense]MCC9034823.1 bacteriocin fulvocin C-related protein [Chryseobacterium muglaense]MCM2553088.1 bacteriocin fulvocin C-related protein [Chryseobacterium muglaense]
MNSFRQFVKHTIPLSDFEEANSFQSKESERLYFNVLNSKDQFQTYNALNSKEKHLVWQGKLDDFISKSELSDAQAELVNRMKSTLSENFFNNISENFNSNEIKLLEIEAMKKFGNLRGLSFFYIMENNYNASNMEQKCFWCNEVYVTTTGPCEIYEINGNLMFLEPIKTAKTRFWIKVGEFDSMQPCLP